MHWAVIALLVPGLWGGILPKFHSNPLEQSFPLEAKGDLHFQIDAVRFLEEGAPAVDLLISLPHAGVAGEADSAHIMAVVRMLDRKGKSMGEFGREMTLPPPPAPTGGDFPLPEQWLRLNPTWLEGTRGVQVRIEDLTALKRGLLDQVRGQHRVGEAAGRITPSPDEPAPLTCLSDPMFVWGKTAGADSASPAPAGKGLRPVRARLQPNPFRFYGLYQPVLTVYWERYPPPAAQGWAQGAPLIERVRIVHLPDSLLVHTAAETTRVSNAPEWTLKRLDLARLPAGSYYFEISLSDAAVPGKGLLARTGGDFQVVWERENWLINENDLLAYGRVLLPAEKFEEFSSLDRGGMETYLRNLWNGHSAAGPGEENELERKFMDRVRTANQEFTGLRPGILSDRGRVYVRYGPPDAVREQLNPQDEELLWITLPQEMWADGVNNAGARERLSRHRSPEDNSAYEIWEYFLRGDPLFPEYVNPNQKTGLKFIFVDELGNGDYTLAYTNVSGALN